jgi:hypothetical protein
MTDDKVQNFEEILGENVALTVQKSLGVGISKIWQSLGKSLKN